MIRGRAVALLLLGGCGMAFGAPASGPIPLRPEAFSWFGPPDNPALRAAWVVGEPSQHGTYLLRVTLAKGGRMAPHTHPDTRSSTVLSGTLYVGFGETSEDARLVPVPAGAVYVAPAGVPHFLWAKDGDVVYQESGTGPTATLPIEP